MYNTVLFNFLLRILFLLVLWMTVAKMDYSNFRSSTFVVVPEADDREPLEDIISEQQNVAGLERCGVSCLSNKRCFSFFHNSGQARCILSSRKNVTLFKITTGFSQYITIDCIHSKAGWQYAGNRRYTVSGRECQRWDKQNPHVHTYQSLEDKENFCRNKRLDRDEEAGPWCFTVDPSVRWESCGLPLCYDFSRNCKTTTKGDDYYGTTNVTKTGSVCNYWSDTSTKNHSYTFLSDHFNYCRNPFGDYNGPWCYSGNSWDYCDIPMCG